MEQHVRGAIYVTDLFHTNFQDFFKYFLVFVLIFGLVFVSVFLEDGAARAGCHICHWLVPHSSATNVFAFSFTWTSLHLFKFYIHAISIHWCNPHVNVCPAAAQIQMNSSRIWICPQIKTMRALSATPTWVMNWQLFLNNPSTDKWQRHRVKKSKLSAKQKYNKSRNLTNPFCALRHKSEFRPNEKSKHQCAAAGECGKYLSLLSQMYFHVASPLG